MLNFKYKILSNWVFNPKDLFDYYDTVARDYQHMKWTKDLYSGKINGAEGMDQFYSWAVQSRYNDISKPSTPYRWSDTVDVLENDMFNKPTELMFGFAKRIYDRFPDVRQMVILAHPPGGKIEMHIDNDVVAKDEIRLHIPIKTTPKSYWNYEDEDIVLQPGLVYLMNTEIKHGTTNLGNDYRIHFMFNLPATRLNEIIDYTVEI
jgi:hypothetical protein